MRDSGTSRRICMLVCLCAVLFQATDGAVEPDSDAEEKEKIFIQTEDALHDALTSNYNKHQMPSSRNATVKLSLGVALINILSIDERKGHITVLAWLRMGWNDVRLKWDPAAYDGIDNLHVPHDHIWIPDIVLYNSAREDSHEVMHNSQSVLVSDGSVLWIPPVVFKSSCSFDMTDFPFDEQICMLKMGSWTYDGFRLDLDFYDSVVDVDLNDFIQHSEWMVTDTSARKNVKYYPCCEEPYPDLTFTIKLKRVAAFYMFMYVGPALLVALLIPLIFLTPVLQPQRHILGMGLLITITLLTGSLDWLFPNGGASPPAIGRYYVGIHVLIFFAMIMATLVANIAERARYKSQPPPGLIKKLVVNFLGKFCCVTSSSYPNIIISERQASDVGTTGIDGNVMLSDVADDTDYKQLTSTGSARACAVDWLKVSLILDRFMFVVFSLLVVAISLAFLPH